MYETHEIATVAQGRRPVAGRRAWLALIPTLAAVLVLLFIIGAACRSGSDGAPGAVGAAATPGETAGPEPTPEPSGSPEAGDGATGPGQGGGSPGGNSGGGNQSGGGGGPAPEQPEPPEPEQPEPVAPLSIQVSLDTVTPGGQCFAAGTIAVDGGEYPVIVHYQFRRVALIDGQLGTEAVTPVHNVAFEEPGTRQVQTGDLPPDGPNVRIFVTGPHEVNSAWVAYESCQDGPGGLTGS